MSFESKPAESLRKGIRRVVRKQMDEAFLGGRRPRSNWNVCAGPLGCAYPEHVLAHHLEESRQKAQRRDQRRATRPRSE